MKYAPCLTPYTKTNLKCIKDLNLKGKTIKLLEQNIGEIHMTLDLAGFLKYDTKNMSNKKKYKVDFTKIKNVRTSKDTIKRVKR